MTPPPRARSPLEDAILQSVIYAAVFDYPLTLPQLRQTLLFVRADEAAISAAYEASPFLRAHVECHDGFFFPRGRRDLLSRRRQRETVSRDLMQRFAGPLSVLVRLPFVRMVALSGSLAHQNADGDADLDLFVIASARRVWTVTVTAIVLARLRGWRKHLCLNYVISDRTLRVAQADLFAANQIVHLRPLSGAATFAAFLDANHFVRRFYPNFAPAAGSATVATRWRRLIEAMLDWTIAPFVERVCEVGYRRYLQRRAHTWTSHEQVRLESECLKLHTSSHRRRVMETFERTLDAVHRASAGPRYKRRIAAAAARPVRDDSAPAYKAT